MNVLAWILGIALAGVFGVAGITKVLDLDRARDHFGYAKREFQLIGLAEILGAAGVVVGLVWRKVEWLGGAAAIALGCLLVGALMAHARVGDDAKKIIPAIVMLVVAIVFVVALSLR